MKRRVLGFLLFLLVVPLFMGCATTTTNAALGTVRFEIITLGDDPSTTEVETEYVSKSLDVDFVESDTLFALLDTNFTISYEESDYGRYLTGIDSLQLTETNQYISFYIDGSYAMTGVDDTALADGAVYQFKIETF